MITKEIIIKDNIIEMEDHHMVNIETNKAQTNKIIKLKQLIILLQLNHKETKVLHKTIGKIIIIDKIEIQDLKEDLETIIVITIGNV